VSGGWGGERRGLPSFVPQRNCRGRAFTACVTQPSGDRNGADETSPKPPRPAVAAIQRDRLDVARALTRVDGDAQIRRRGSFGAKHAQRSEPGAPARLVVVKIAAEASGDG